MGFDFGYNGAGNAPDGNAPDGNAVSGAVTNIDDGSVNNDVNGSKADDLDGKTQEPATQEPNDTNEPSDNTKPAHDLEVGTSIEVGDVIYTIDKDGNAVDSNGNIFKNAADVKEWIESFDKVDDDSNKSEINISSIQDIVGITVTDENDKPVEFENTPEGVKAYLDSVIETKRNEHYETAINTLYQKYPFVNDIINYYIANGGSLKGFNEVPDRSNIVLDDSNEAQCESIIKTAWAERKQKGDVEHYLNYLKSSGTLAVVAREELESLQEADREYKAKLEAEAEKIEQQQMEEDAKYWNQVHEIIKSKKIADYTIPDTIVINRNGQKISATPEDFFKYLYLVDPNNESAYVKDLKKETPESRLNDELLRAYLKFTGGNYSNLVDMAINNEKVAKLKLKAKQAATSSIRISKPKVAPNKGANLDLGYK